MAKTVSSAGLNEFIQTGKPTLVYPSDPKEAAKIGAQTQAGAPTAAKAPDAPSGPVSDGKPPETAPAASADALKAEEGLEPEDNDLPERARKRIGKKHYEMKKAQEEAEEAARFAEQQFNERRELEKRLQMTEAERDELRKQTAPKPVTPPILVKPDPRNYLDDKGQFRSADYDKALDEYAKSAVENDRREQQAAQAKAAAEAEGAAFKARIEKATEKYKDYDEVVSKTPVMLQNEALTYIRQSDYGPDLAYYLADPKNRAVADRIAAMHPIRAIAELGKLETSFEKPAVQAEPAKTNGAAPPQATSQTVERQGAPAPITPLSASGGATVNTDPAKMSFKELRAYERARALEKKRR